MNRDKDRFNKILFVVFMLALAFGAYLILGPKVTALINTHGQINEINLSGTFRIYILVQFISLAVSIITLITQTVKHFLPEIGRKSNSGKGLMSYLGGCFGLLSVGGAIINVSWMVLFINWSYRRSLDGNLSKDDLFNRILHLPSILKDEYIKFFREEKQFSYLKGMLSLLFWALLSLFLAAIIRWQAGTNGCEYSWRGDTQEKETIEAEAKFFGTPIQHFVKIPQSIDVDYLDYMKGRIENSALSGTQGNDIAVYKPEYRDSKTCWRRFILGILIFYAVFLRVLLAFFYFIFYKCTDRPNASLKGPVRDHGYNKTQKTEGAKPFPNIKERSVTTDVTDPYLLLAFGFGIDLSYDAWRAIFHEEPKDLVTYGNVADEGKGTAGESENLSSHFIEWLDENGGIVSDMIVLIDLCKVPIVDDLDFLSNEIFQRLPCLRRCRVFLSNGERLRVMSSNPKGVEERVEDWKEKLSELYHTICEKRKEFFSFETVDWFDNQLRTLNADLRLAAYLRKEFTDRFGEDGAPSIKQQHRSLFRTAMKIIISSFDRYVRERDNLDFITDDLKDRSRQIFENHLREGEARLTFLYTTGEDRPASNDVIEGAVEFAGDILEKGKDVLARGKQIAGDVKETVQGNPILFRKVGAEIVQKFLPRKNTDQTAEKAARYNADRAYASILIEYALALEMQGRPLVRKARSIDQMMSKFSATPLLFGHDDLESILTQITEQIEGDPF